MSNFSLEHANNLPIDQCKEYITKYFYPLTTSQHIMISYDQDGKVVYEIKEDQAVKKYISIVCQKMLMISILKSMTKLKHSHANLINRCYLIIILILVRLFYIK